MADPLEEAPRTLDRTDEETLGKAGAWIQEGHPRDCWHRLGALASDATREYQTLWEATLTHIIEQHTSETSRLAHLPKDASIRGADREGLDHAIENHSEQLADITIEEWDDLAEAPTGPWFVNLVAARLDFGDFKRLWHAVWDKPEARASHLLKSVLWAANAHDGFTEERTAFLDDRLDQVTDLLGLEPAVQYVAAAPLDKNQRDSLLNRLLDDHGIDVARLLANRSPHPVEPISAILRAYKLLKEDDPYAAETQGTLAHALRADPEAVAGDIAKLVNDDGILDLNGERFHLLRELEWAIIAEMTAGLLRAIGDDALTRDERRHDNLATQVHFLRVPAEFIIDWARETIGREEAVDYNAGLLRLYLSNDKVADDAKEIMANLAEALFDEYGKPHPKRVFEQWNVAGASRIHKAVALMREIGNPPPPRDVEAIIQSLQEYPTTLVVLGGKAFETWLHQNPNDFVVAHWYEARAGDAYSELAKTLPTDLDDVRGVERAHRRLEDDFAFRTRWEQRFRLLRDHGINFEQNRLRTRKDAWIEAMIGARLLEAGFHIRREPSDVLPDGPDLDYLVKDPASGEEFFFEIQRLGPRPDEVFDRVYLGYGGEPKKSLQNKLNRQLRGGQLDPERPLIIGLQVPSTRAFDYSLLNSLYGVFGVGWVMGDQGKEVEGTQRDTKDMIGIFYEPEAAFVSGVLALTPEGPRAAHLTGRMFWPMEKPPHPLSPPLYARLRDALLGELPESDVERMMRIPTLVRDEAEALVQAGVDSPIPLALGQLDFDDLPLGKERLQELVVEIHWQARLQEQGRIEFLKTAQGVDVTPLLEADIRTLPQLLRADQRPEGLPEGIWYALRMEAARRIR